MCCKTSPRELQLGINAVFYYSTSFFKGIIANPMLGTCIISGRCDDRDVDYFQRRSHFKTVRNKCAGNLCRSVAGESCPHASTLPSLVSHYV